MADSINAVALSGNLTADPELRATPGGTPVLKFRMAFSKGRKNAQTGQWENRSGFVGVAMFGKRAESLAGYMAKGMHVAVTGELEWSEWVGGDGSRRSEVSLVASNVELPPRERQQAAAATAAAPAPAACDVYGDEVPF